MCPLCWCNLRRAIAGATGGFVASGGSLREKLVGLAAGGLAGGAVGFYAPHQSHFVGMAAAGAKQLTKNHKRYLQRSQVLRL